jgi:5'-nucleotidase
MKRGRSFWSGILLFCLLISCWQASASAQSDGNKLQIKILAINDFHGHLSTDGLPDKGSAPVLAAYLEDVAKGWEGRIFLVHAGDQVGASSAASTFLKEEPSISFLNLLARRPGWSIIGTLGNHEFDQGKDEMLRLIHGGNHKRGPFLENPYPGAHFPYICANVIREDTSQPLLLPFVIREVEGVPLAFIGAVTTETPSKVAKSAISGLRFQDEAEAINSQVSLLKRWGVKAFVVLIHEGGCGQPPFEEKTGPWNDNVRGRIVDIVHRLDDVDVVITGHTHKFINAMLENNNHKRILVTQSIWHGIAFADIVLTIDRRTQEVVEKWAQIEPTYRNKGLGCSQTHRCRNWSNRQKPKLSRLLIWISKRSLVQPKKILKTSRIVQGSLCWETWWPTLFDMPARPNWLLLTRVVSGQIRLPEGM